MDERIKTAIDMMLAMVIEELEKDSSEAEDTLFVKFIRSKTGQLLLDEKSKLWWCGPSDIAQMYKEETR